MCLTLSASCRAVLFSLFMVLTSTFSVFSQTSVFTPTVEGNWTKDKSPYRLSADVTVPAGKTLTIEPGVVVEWVSGFKITVEGTLKAEGSASDSIRFEGQFRAAAVVSQEFINVTANSQNTTFKYVKFNRFTFIQNNEQVSTLTLRSSSAIVDNCRFSENGGNAIKIDNAAPAITNTAFQSGISDIVTSVDNLPALEQNGLLKFGLLNGMTKDIALKKGNQYTIVTPLTIPQGRILTINPGVQVLFATGKSLVTVEGTFKADGLVNDSIRFAPYPSTGNGVGPIVFNPSSTNNSISFANVSGLTSANSTQFGSAIVVASASTTINNNFINSTSGNGIFFNGISAPVQNNRFVSATIDVVTNVEFIPALTGNGRLKVALLAMSGSVTLPNLHAYRLLRPFVIPAATTLTIEPGVEILIPIDANISVLGTLKAEGTAIDSIRFTGQNALPSLESSSSTRSQGPIVFEDGSTNSSLKYVSISNLGYLAPSPTTAAVVIRTTSAFISNSSIINSNGSGVKFDIPNPQLNSTRPQLVTTVLGSRYHDVVATVDHAFRVTPEGAIKIGLVGGLTMNATLIKGPSYSILSNITVPASTTLTIEPGARLEFFSAVLTVRGTLKAEGTSDNRITFKGNRNGDYTFLGYAFGSVNFMEESQNSTFKHVDLDGFGFIRWDRTPGLGSGTIRIFTSSVTVENCNFTNITGGGIEMMVNTAQPVLKNNNFAVANFDAIVGFDHISLLEGNNVPKIAIRGLPMAKDVTLKGDRRYYLVGTGYVSPNRKLTIEAGVTLEYLGAAVVDNGFAFGGTVEALGTAAKPINIVRSQLPYDGTSFGGFIIAAQSQNSILSHVNIDGFGLAGIQFTTVVSKPALSVLSATTRINNITVTNSAYYGVLIQTAGPITISNSCITNNRAGAVVSTQGAHRFVNTNFANNFAFAINNTSTNAADIITATNCWWGNATGPSHQSNPSGTGDIVSDKVNFTPWSTVAFACNAVIEAPLPVKLRFFKSVAINGDVFNEWQTESEINAGHFIVQRSYSGNDFQDVGKVSATSQGAATVNYNFTDKMPASGVIYYRLKMVDKDGSFTLSTVNRVTVENKTGMVIFPNPVRSVAQVRISADKAENVLIRIIDVTGKIVKQINTRIEIGVTNISIPAGDLGQGTYYLEMSGKSGMRRSFVKQ